MIVWKNTLPFYWFNVQAATVPPMESSSLQAIPFAKPTNGILDMEFVRLQDKIEK